MGIVVQKSAKTLLVTYLGFALGLINTLWLFPLALTEEQIGLTRLLLNVSFLFASFAALGAPQVPNRFFPYFNNPAKKHYGFFAFLLTMGAVGFSIFLILFLSFKNTVFSIYADKASLLTEYFYHLIPFTFFALFINIIESYNTIQLNPVVPSFLREFLVRFLLTVGVVFFFYNLISFNSFINFMIAFYGVSLIILIIYTKQKGYLFLSSGKEIVKSDKFKEIIVYCSFMLVANISGSIIQNIDGLVLSAYSGLKNTGIYSIAFFIATVIEAPRRSMSQVVVPLVSNANKENDMVMLKTLYKKSSINQLVIGGLLFLIIWCNIDSIFKLIPNGHIYAAGKWVVFYLGLSKIFDMAMGINAEIVGTSKYYKFDIIFYTSLGFLAIATNLLFIPKYGLVGAAFAGALSVFIYNVARFIFLLVVMKIQPFSINTLKVLVIWTLFLITDFYLKTDLHFIIDAIVRTSFISLIFFFLIYKLTVSEDINKIADKYISLLKNRA